MNTETALEALQAKYRRARMLNVVLAATSVFLLLVAVANFTSPGQSTVAPASDPSAAGSAGSAVTEPGFEKRDPNDYMAIGDVNAPVVLVEWFDVRCTYCTQFARETLPVLIQDYVDTGKVRIEFRDVAFFGPESQRGAAALRAAGEQGKFIEYMRALYEAAPERGRAEMTDDELLDYAKAAGVPDLDKFAADATRDDLMQAVAESTDESQQLGVNSVPFFAVGREPLTGAQPVENFRKLLDTALAEVE